MQQALPPRAPEVLDVERLDLLAHQLGDADLVVELVEMLLEDVGDRVDRGRSAAVCGDLDVSRREAHSLSSAARQLGGDLLAAAAAEVEHGRAEWTLVESLLPAATSAWSAWVARAGDGSGAILPAS